MTSYYLRFHTVLTHSSFACLSIYTTYPELYIVNTCGNLFLNFMINDNLPVRSSLIERTHAHILDNCYSYIEISARGRDTHIIHFFMFLLVGITSFRWKNLTEKCEFTSIQSVSSTHIHF